MLKEHLMVPLFQKFIASTKSGRRLNINGTRIRPQTISNYDACFKLLTDFELAAKSPIIVYEVKGNNKREHNKLQKYWRNFYKKFTDYLYMQKKCYDNYTGQNIKMIRVFFGWLNNNTGILTGPYYKKFYVTREVTPIITLTVEQLKFLAFNKVFEAGLSKPLQRSKDILVFGCFVGLRYGDLSSLKPQNIEMRDGHTYLSVRSQKTHTETKVKLPAQALEIIDKYKRNNKKLLPSISLVNFNKNIKKLAERAGWVQPVYKTRSIRGVLKNIPGTSKLRFCDILTSHTMRRTCITIMLTSGMPEYTVRKISGHTSDSKEFFRYVNLAQSLMDKEIEKMHQHFEIPDINHSL